MKTQEPAPRAGVDPCSPSASDLDRLYRRYASRLLTRVRRRFGPSIAEDVCQTTWAALAACGYVPDRVYPFLCVVAERRAWRLIHKTRPEFPWSGTQAADGGEVIELPLGEWIEHPVCVDDAIDARLALAEVASLPTRQRDAVAHRVAGLNTAEAAQRTGRTVRQIRRDRERAQASLAA